MSKVTEELDFLWRQRLVDWYNELMIIHDFEGAEYIVLTLKLQGLTVKGIEL